MFAVATEGAALVADGEVAAGMRRLDEAAAAALGGEYEDLRAAGWTCCYLIGACEQVRDFGRAAQWCREVEAFSRRLDIRFVTGVCQTHYGAVLTWRGEWDEAERVLVAALEQLTAARPAWRADAVVRLAELRRRQGRVDEALALFGEAERHPLAQLGRAELSLARGEVGPRARGPRTAAAPHPGRATRPRAPGRSRRWSGRRRRPATTPPRPGTRGSCARSPRRSAPRRCSARRASPRASSPPRPAITPRRAIASTTRPSSSRAAGAPLEAARARLGLGEALRALGRTEAAEHEAAAARAAVEALGAERGRRGTRGPRRSGDRAAAPLTPRELEVLRLVADGLGDRAIAERLTLSEHTVHRHVANIHAKLRCSSRAAAVALAHRRGLL